MEISDEKLQKALNYLVKTDEEEAVAKALVEGLSEQRKTLKAVLFNKASGSNDVRANAAYASDEYLKHVNKLSNAIADYHTLKNKRLTASLIIEVWRSCNANRRVGNV